jgi:beta-1,4-mannosyltransferase
MNVVFLPDFSRGNHYQCELRAALTRLDVDVVMGGSARLPLLRAVGMDRRPDILHLHWIHPFLLSENRVKNVMRTCRFVTEILVVKLLGIRIVWTIHNLTGHERPSPWLEMSCRRLFARLSDRLIVHCPAAREAVVQAYHLSGRSRQKIHVIPHGHYLKSYENRIGREEAKARLGLGKSEVTFLYFGQIRPYKGVFQLIERFQKLESCEVRLLLAGKPLNETIRAEVVRRCESDGRIQTHLQFIPDDDIQVYMNAADVVVLPYRDVLTSGAVILAMSFGRPVIAPSVGCIADVLDDEGGFMYSASDPQGLIKAMRGALDANLIRMGNHNRRVAERLEWDEIGQETYEVYRRCLTGRGFLAP